MDTSFDDVPTLSPSEDNEAGSRGIRIGTSNVQEKDEPGTERDLIQGQPLNLISTEDGLHVRTLDNNNLAETESEHGMESLSPRSENEVLRSYEAAAADGDSYKQIDHLENAVQKYKTENQILKARKVASDDASHVDDHHEQPRYMNFQDGNLERIEASAGASCMISTGRNPQSAPINHQEVTGVGSAFLRRHSQDEDLLERLQASPGASNMVSSYRIPQSALMNDQEVAGLLVTGIDSAFLQRHSQDEALVEGLQGSVGASCMVSSELSDQFSTRGPSENNCVCQEVNYGQRRVCRVRGTITPTHDTCCICLQVAFSGLGILSCSHKAHIECLVDMILHGGRDGRFICPSCGFVFLRRG